MYEEVESHEHGRAPLYHWTILLSTGNAIKPAWQYTYCGAPGTGSGWCDRQSTTISVHNHVQCPARFAVDSQLYSVIVGDLEGWLKLIKSNIDDIILPLMSWEVQSSVTGVLVVWLRQLAQHKSSRWVKNGAQRQERLMILQTSPPYKNFSVVCQCLSYNIRTAPEGCQCEEMSLCCWFTLSAPERKTKSFRFHLSLQVEWLP